MRSRIIKSVSESVIAYKIGDELPKIQKIASSLKIKLLIADDDRAGEQVGFLAGYTGFASNNSREEAESGCLIFAGLSHKQLDSFLDMLKKDNIVIPYKAVITASNQSWSLKKLVGELQKEREHLGG